MQPIVMPPNILDHFYLGGQRIADLRGVDMPSPQRPEEWLAATTHRAGESESGLSRVPDGRLLRDLIAADPQGWLGRDAASLIAACDSVPSVASGDSVPSVASGDSVRPVTSGDTGLLVKLLDPGQRLPVHVHPDRDFAVAHLNCPYGKTEAWYVLDVSGEQPSVWLGFNQDVDPEELSRRVDLQDSEWMLSRMNRLDVRPGDGILVPAGTAHAIGEGVFVAEVQEPTDFSILLEWSITTATREESHLDLGLPLALKTLNHQAFSAAQLDALVQHNDPTRTGDQPQRLLPEAADFFFRLHQLAPASGTAPAIPAGFTVIVVLEGSGVISSVQTDSKPVSVKRGQVLAMPANYGAWAATGDVRLLACRAGSDWPGSLAQHS